MKVIAWYLPQFHEIPENNEWWGQGFTEWVNVKKAKKYHKDQYQPRIPLNNNYYCLLDIDTQRWQVELAKKYGIYGFCMHHYWFDGKLLLEKPVEQYLKHPELDLPFCLSWANEHWTNAWVDGGSRILIEQRYGNRKEWKEHFDYLLPFFKDPRYMKSDGKPIFIVYRPELIDCLSEMLEYWRELSISNGFPGMCFCCKGADDTGLSNDHDKYSKFDYNIDYQPGKIFNRMISNNHPIRVRIQKFLDRYFAPLLHIDFGRFSVPKLKTYSYDEVWNAIVEMRPSDRKNVPGAFVDWDCTPRKGIGGSFMMGASPDKFEKYFEKQVINTKQNYKKDMLFLFAWNEWAESGYLEPDEKYKYSYLEAIYRVLEKTGELEKIK